MQNNMSIIANNILESVSLHRRRFAGEKQNIAGEAIIRYKCIIYLICSFFQYISDFLNCLLNKIETSFSEVYQLKKRITRKRNEFRLIYIVDRTKKEKYCHVIVHTY